MTVGVLILAAGVSRRFQDDKRKALLPNGKTILLTTIEKVEQIFDPVCLVVRPNETRESLGIEEKEVHVIHALSLQQGIGDSIAQGMGAAINIIKFADSVKSFAVFLADMPFVGVDILQKLENQAAHDNIVIPCYQAMGNQTKGNPVVFGRLFWPELCRLHGMVGGKALLKKYKEQCLYVTSTDVRITTDIDTAESLQVIWNNSAENVQR